MQHNCINALLILRLIAQMILAANLHFYVLNGSYVGQLNDRLIEINMKTA
jgi:hypothetical protein